MCKTYLHTENRYQPYIYTYLLHDFGALSAFCSISPFCYLGIFQVDISTIGVDISPIWVDISTFGVDISTISV